MRVLIVDDEPIAQNILQNYVLKIDGIEIAGKCNDALEAFNILAKEKIDLLLLDINMPEINGLNFIKTLKSPPYVIFTTAYTEYAVESYELNAVDYLVKPIAFERFLKAINKVTAMLQAGSRDNMQLPTTGLQVNDEVLFVKSDGKLVKIDLPGVWFIESLKDYICLWTDSGKIMVLSTMRHFEEQLQGNNLFLRISRSCIVNIKHIKEIEGNTIRVNNQSLVIGNTYRNDVHEVFERLKLS